MAEEQKKKWTAEQLARGEDFLSNPLPEQQSEIDEARRRIMAKEGGPTSPLPHKTQAELYMERKRAGGRTYNE